MHDETKALLSRTVFALAVVFTGWAMWRWANVLSEDPAPGAYSERRARVLELACSTVVALAATGFSSRLVFRPGMSTPPTGPPWVFDDHPELNRKPVGKTVNLRPGDVVEVPVATESGSSSGLQEIERPIAARMATAKAALGNNIVRSGAESGSSTRHETPPAGD